MIDLRNPGQLFEFKGVLHRVIGWAEGPTVIIEPVEEKHYEHCECGRPLPNQQSEHVMSAPNLQDGIMKVYESKKVERKER